MVLLKILFNILSVIFVVLGLLAFLASEATIGMFFIAIGMVGIGVAAYNRT
jgi:hypothetical protein